MEQVYYAIDPCDRGETVEVLQTCFDRSPAGVHWFALVDLAFVTESPSDLRSFGQFAPAPLFIEPPLDKLADASPALISLADEPGVRTAQTSRLLRLTHGMPMLGFIGTRRDREEQIAAWQPYVHPRCVDEQRVVLRFADTRVAAGLHETLSAEHWRGLVAGLQSWLIVGREGAVIPLIDESTAAGPLPACEPVCLSAQELGALMAWGEPDAVIAALHRQAAELLPQAGRAQLHSLMAQACRLARKAGIGSFEDLVDLAHAVVLTGGAVLTNPRLKPLLAERRMRGQLASALLDLLPQA